MSILKGPKSDAERQRLWHEKKAAGEPHPGKGERKLASLSADEELLFFLGELNENTRRINEKIAFLFWGAVILIPVIVVFPFLAMALAMAKSFP